MGECVLMRDLDRKLLKETFEQFDKDITYIKLDHPHELLDYLKNYNVKNIGEHWYDADPPECKTCHFQINKKEHPCNSCPFLAIWKISEKCLSEPTWIDVWGPDSWDMGQEQTNELYDHMIVDLLEEIDLTDRVYLPNLKNSTDITIYIYTRDIKNCDYSFVLEKK